MELTVGDEYMRHDCVELLLKAVLSPSSLEHLTLLSMDLPSLSLAPLKGNCNITTLEFEGCTLGSEDISCIAEVLHSNITLTTLGIGTIGFFPATTKRSLKKLTVSL